MGRYCRNKRKISNCYFNNIYTCFFKELATLDKEFLKTKGKDKERNNIPRKNSKSARKTTTTKITKSNPSKEQEQQPRRPKKILPKVILESVDNRNLSKVRSEFVSPTWSKLLSEELKSCALQNETASNNQPNTPTVSPNRYGRERRMNSFQCDNRRTNTDSDCDPKSLNSLTKRSTSITNFMTEKLGDTKNKEKATKTARTLPIINTTDRENCISEHSSCLVDISNNDDSISQIDSPKYNPKYNPDNDRITKFDDEIAAVFQGDDDDDFDDDDCLDLSSLSLSVKTPPPPMLSHDLVTASVEHRNNRSARSSLLINANNQQYIDISDKNSDINNNNSRNNLRNTNNNNNNNNNSSSNNRNSSENKLSLQKNKFLHLTDVVRSMSKSPSGKPIGLDQI